MLALLGTMYVLHQLAAPAGYALAGDPSVDGVAVRSFAREGPRTAALAANGAVAAIVDDAERVPSRRRIVVWRADGSRVMIGMPGDAVLHQAFQQYVGGDRPFPYASFSRVVLAADGTTFATVTNPFSGAYSGIAKHVFRWTGTTWESVRTSQAVPRDIDVAAADSQPLHVGITGDFSSGFLTYDEVVNDPAFERPEALSYAGATVRRLGIGTLTGLAGAYACGFIGEQDGLVMPDNVNVEGQVPYALLWHGGATKRLGRGIAFGVNTTGVAVGDNRVSVQGGPRLATRAEYDRLKMTPGVPPVVRPVRWDARGPTTLGHEPGTAFAIASDGTIVGALEDGRGFVSRGSRVTILDGLVAGGHAHILGAYAINGRGRILVLTGTGPRASTGLAYLDRTP